jgi:hypothetical protein
VIDLEHALTDLADHLDYPGFDSTSDQAAALRDRLGGTRRNYALLVAAAVIVFVVAGVVAIAPAREAVADWLGIGAVEIRRSGQPVPTATGRAPVPGATGTPGTANPAAAAQLAEARRSVDFAIRTPSASAAGALTKVAVDRRVPGGLVALSYRRFTVVEIATDPTKPMPLFKFVGGADLVDTTVAGQSGTGTHPGLWVGAPHAVGFIDRSGEYVQDTVRRSGPVLLWQDSGVTYRIEGLRTLDEARAVAATLG